MSFPVENILQGSHSVGAHRACRYRSHLVGFCLLVDPRAEISRETCLGLKKVRGVLRLISTPRSRSSALHGVCLDARSNNSHTVFRSILVHEMYRVAKKMAMDHYKASVAEHLFILISKHKDRSC